MSTMNIQMSVSSLTDRRMFDDRRVNQFRRNMTRFDKNGGDRRSGYARRQTDEGLRDLVDEG